MRKAPTVLVLILSLLWHGYAVAHGAWAGHDVDLAHVAMHLDNEPHHHHDDGSYHHDTSDESLQHVAADGCANLIAVLPTCTQTALHELRATAQYSPAPPAHASPVLEGPRRPPRLRS